MQYFLPRRSNILLTKRNKYLWRIQVRGGGFRTKKFFWGKKTHSVSERVGKEERGRERSKLFPLPHFPSSSLLSHPPGSTTRRQKGLIDRFSPRDRSRGEERKREHFKSFLFLAPIHFPRRGGEQCVQHKKGVSGKSA